MVRMEDSRHVFECTCEVKRLPVRSRLAFGLRKIGKHYQSPVIERIKQSLITYHYLFPLFCCWITLDIRQICPIQSFSIHQFLLCLKQE